MAFNSNNKEIDKIINKYFKNCLEIGWDSNTTKITLDFSEFLAFVKTFNENKEAIDDYINDNYEKELLYDDLCLRYTLARERQMLNDIPELCKERGKDDGLKVAKIRSNRDCVAFYQIAEKAVYGKEGKPLYGRE